jgi:phosphonopyruvate decarboxylase
MIQPKDFFEAMIARGVGFFVGVPDSLLANFCAYVDDQGGRNQHLITANEGNAVALALGYHISSGKVAMVYMQNSGLGNTINPLTSLADPEVYKVPMLLVIGWRGEPGVKDEPQHVKQGRITLEQLNILEIPHWIIDANTDVTATLDAVFASMCFRNAPVALVVRKDTFAWYKSQNTRLETSTLLREDALEQLLKLCSDDDLIISTTGKTSREVFEIRANNMQKQRDFLTVGGMGHTASIALGMAIGQPNRRVVCLDGDGSLLMHMGSMPVIAEFKPRQFFHVLLNNGSHESVGGQATSASIVNFAQLANAVGYEAYAVASDVLSLQQAWISLIDKKGPVLLEVKIKSGSRDNLGRPTSSAEQNKVAFMDAINV